MVRGCRFCDFWSRNNFTLSQKKSEPPVAHDPTNDLKPLLATPQKAAGSVLCPTEISSAAGKFGKVKKPRSLK
jgi:hypothetical protein